MQRPRKRFVVVAAKSRLPLKHAGWRRDDADVGIRHSIMNDGEDLSVRPVNLFIANAGGTLDGFVDAINEAFEAAVAPTKELLCVEGVNVLVIDASDDVIPEWGGGGYTYGPHAILIDLDPSAVVDRHHIERTIVP